MECIRLPPMLRSLQPKTLTFFCRHFQTFSLSLLKYYTHRNHFHQILSHAIASGVFIDPFVSSKLLLHALSSSSFSFPFCRSLFLQIRNPNAFSWNFMLRAYSRSSSPEDALHLYNQMICANGLVPDKYVFPFVLKACGRICCREKGHEIHCTSLKLGLEFDVFVQNALIFMYFQCECIELARMVFDMVPSRVRDVVTWNSVISGCLQRDCCDEALQLFGKLLSDDYAYPNEVTLVSVLTVCARMGLLDLGLKLHRFTIVNGFKVDVFLATALIDMYTKCAQSDNARKVFDRISERNNVCWTSMISGYARFDLFHEAIDLFREMQFTGFKPDSATVACILSACGHAGALDQGRWVHGYCDRNGIEMNNLSLKTALIDMYSKCGEIAKAIEVFETSTHNDVFSWTAMISGLAINGQSQKALNLFAQMEKSIDVKPNEVTFLGVLSACSHSGLVDEGLYYFKAMNSRYNLIPHIEHYGCLVDLLGRANRFVECVEFIKLMPIKPDVVIWRSLLFASRSHGNIGLAEFAAQKIEELEPEKCGAPVLLSNLYASAARWSDVKKVRRGMAAQGIKKQPGCSFVEINSIVHEFLVADDSHSEIGIVRQTIKEISEIVSSEEFELYMFEAYD